MSVEKRKYELKNETIEAINEVREIKKKPDSAESYNDVDSMMSELTGK